MSAASRLRQIESARRAVLYGAGSVTDALVQAWHDRAWLERSWRRCLAQGRRPEQRVTFDAVPAGTPRQVADLNHDLLRAARPELERLARAVAPIRYFVLLADAHGTVVDAHGAIDHDDTRASVIARVGVDLSERSIGTSAIGAALGELQPVWLHRGEHFFQDTGVYSCAGAPLFGPSGRCVGMLDLTGIEVPERPELKHLVARSARAIEAALALAVPHALQLSLAWADSLPGDEPSALLCLDAEGTVVSSNGAAREMLPQLQALAHGPVHASELFALPWQHLFDQAARAEPAQVPLWSGLRLAVRARRPRTDPASPASPTRLPLKTLEAELIHQTVREAGGNVDAAARTLGVSRATVYRRLAAERGGGRSSD